MSWKNLCPETFFLPLPQKKNFKKGLVKKIIDTSKKFWKNDRTGWKWTTPHHFSNGPSLNWFMRTNTKSMHPCYSLNFEILPMVILYCSPHIIQSFQDKAFNSCTLLSSSFRQIQNHCIHSLYSRFFRWQVISSQRCRCNIGDDSSNRQY